MLQSQLESDKVAHGIAVHQHRLALYALEHTETPISVTDLASIVEEMYPESEREKKEDFGWHVKVTLLHRSIPTLERAGLVEYNHDDNMVTEVNTDVYADLISAFRDRDMETFNIEDI